MSAGWAAAPKQPIMMGQFWVCYDLYSNCRALMLEPKHDAWGCGPAMCVARLPL